MKSLRHTALIVLLMLSLPAQSLALALSECKQHQSDTGAAHHVVISEPEDCHGAHTEHRDESASEQDSANAGSINCFHCSGVCQSSKPLSLMVSVSGAHEIRDNVFSPMTEATRSGIPTEVSRPPCNALFS